MNERPMVLFQQAIKSSATRKMYENSLEQFLKFSKISVEEIGSIPRSEIQILVEDYVFSLKNRNLTRMSIKGYLQGVKLFLEMSDVVLNWTKIKRFYPEASKPSGQKAYTNEDVREILNSSINKKFRCLVHLMASSGMRIGGVRELQLKHLEEMPHGCKSVLVYAGTKDEYQTFISPEAVKALDDYLDERISQGDKINSDSFVIVTSKRGFKPCNDTTIRMVIARNVGKLKTSKLITGNRTDKMVNHAFRKRFNTIMKSNKEINLVLAERLLGHSVTIPLDNSYLDVSKEELFKQYLLALPELYIDEKYKLEAKLIERQQQIEELESKDNKIKALELQMQEMKMHMENIISKS
ncbi:site-specific integrase [Candidatus Nitrosopelagicus sp.]|nr:site-specific integrase [Candidatus Nitrosopelagicus sp.]